MFQMKKQDKIPEELSEMETGSLPEKEFKVMSLKMIKELKKKTHEQSEKLEAFNKELENIKRDSKKLSHCPGFGGRGERLIGGVLDFLGW